MNTNRTASTALIAAAALLAGVVSASDQPPGTDAVIAQMRLSETAAREIQKETKSKAPREVRKQQHDMSRRSAQPEAKAKTP
jgi:hypothetical protein